MKTFTKKYQVWCKDPQVTDVYIFIEYDSLEECISAPKLGNDWYITKKVSLAVTEAETESYGIVIPKQRPIESNDKQLVVDNRPEPTPEELAAEELAAKYAGGPIGNI